MLYTSQQQVRAAFWDECNPRFERIKGQRQNEYSADIRQSFVSFVDNLARNSHITEALAQRVTL